MIFLALILGPVAGKGSLLLNGRKGHSARFESHQEIRSKGPKGAEVFFHKIHF